MLRSFRLQTAMLRCLRMKITLQLMHAQIQGPIVTVRCLIVSFLEQVILLHNRQAICRLRLILILSKCVLVKKEAKKPKIKIRYHPLKKHVDLNTMMLI